MSYEWITPKTDWTTTTRFEYTDYNRIRNNLLYINDMLNELYPDKAQTLDLGNAKTGYTNEYAVSEFNAFEDALESFTRVGQDVNVGDRNYYRGNNSFIWADALNRLEQCCLKWYNLDPVVTGVVLSPSTFELQVGETQQLTLTVEPSNAEYTVEYSSSNNNTMTVNNTGLVTCVSLNKANTTITATVKQKGVVRATATCTAVALIPVTGISLSRSSVEGRYETYSRVLVTVTPSNATHKDDWVVTTQEKIGTKDIKTSVYKTADCCMVEVRHKKETAGGGLIFSSNGICEKLVVIDIPVTVSLDGFSATFTYSSYPRGSYELGTKKVKDLITSQECYYISSRLVKKGSSASTSATLIYWSQKNLQVSESTGDPTGIYDDRIAPYRTAIKNYIDNYFSDKLKNALQSFSKIVHTAKGNNSKASYSAKYHLLSYNEIDGQWSPPDGILTTLGSDTYPYILSAKIAGMSSDLGSMMRSKFIAYDSYEESFGCDNGSIGTAYNVWFGGSYPLQPLINLLGNIKLNLEGEDGETNYYSIDWTNTSNITLYSIPLGSVIADTDGYKST